jgi:hypothetical protein
MILSLRSALWQQNLSDGQIYRNLLPKTYAASEKKLGLFLPKNCCIMLPVDSIDLKSSWRRICRHVQTILLYKMGCFLA